MATTSSSTGRILAWVLVPGFLFALAGVAWNLAPLFDPNRKPPRGDGKTAASYGFDLSNALVPASAIVSSGMIADALSALDDPETMAPGAVSSLTEIERGKYLLPGDRVIGISIDGATRAYPLRVLVWHEIVNDNLGGVPIAVTYNPLSEGIAVFDRRVGSETLRFGVSGLLYQSNLLLYDRRDAPESESLWSQLQARAIAGPAAGTELRLLPCALSRFDRWVERNPDTSVLAPIAAEADQYRQDVWGSYFSSDALRYPVDPLPPGGTLPLKQRVLVTGSPGSRAVIPLTAPAGQTRPDEVVGPDDGSIRDGIYAFWFAWYATHPDDPGAIAAD